MWAISQILASFTQRLENYVKYIFSGDEERNNKIKNDFFAPWIYRDIAAKSLVNKRDKIVLMGICFDDHRSKKT